MSRAWVRAAFGAALVSLLAGAAGAQDFQQTYQIGAGGAVSIHNVSGDVKVTGYDGEGIVVAGYKEGRDRDLVKVEDRSGGNRVDVRVRYPEQCDCNASIRFEVKVPRGTSYNFDEISSVSGSVEVTGVTGKLQAKSVSGDVTVRGVTGPVNATAVSGSVRVEEVLGLASAKSTSGDVEVAIARLEGSEGMEFSSISGNVQVRLPAGLDADVEMSVLSGSLKTDFPLQIEERGNGPGRRARGQIGAGSRRLRLTSTSGNVSLLRN